MPTARFDLDTLEFQAVRELLIERLQTALGRRAVQELAPIEDEARLDATRRQVAEIAKALSDDQEPPASGAVEIRSWLGPFFEGHHQPETRDVADLMRLLQATARCQGWLARREDSPALVALSSQFPPVADLADELSGIVDSRGEVLDSASVRLAEIRTEIEEAENGVRAALHSFLSDERNRRCLQSPEASWRHGRPVVQVRFEQRRQIRGVQHDRSQSGATVFVEPEVVVEAANRLSDLRGDEHREVQVVLTQTCRGLRRSQEEIERACVVMSELDLTVARARLITEDGYLPAVVSVGGPLRLRRARHPLLERSGIEDPVPLDLTLGDPFSMLVVTGPNTGGKTVAMKTVGLLAVMALCAVPVPAEEGTEFPLLDGVFADIGDEQGIRQNLSTFSSHVTRIARCIRESGPNTLVLLDELGAGTDPEEGGALGEAVLEDLARRKVLSVVTTHIGRLKDFAYQNPQAENGAMAFDGKTLAPIYRLDVGIPGSSHALDIARRVGLAERLVDRARELLGERDLRVEQMIERVQVARQEAEAQRRRTEQLSRQAERKGQEVELRSKDMERKRAWLGEEADALVDEQMKKLRTALVPGLERLRGGPKSVSEEAAALLSGLQQVVEETSVHRRRMRFLGSVRKDTIVFVPRLGKRCVIRKIDRAKQLLTVEVGKMRVEVAFEDVSWIQPLDA
ncbi:MAG: hypothetical protein AAF196_14920 [Planctomycetota bacterium]